jgi:hypothetical protein
MHSFQAHTKTEVEIEGVHTRDCADKSAIQLAQPVVMFVLYANVAYARWRMLMVLDLMLVFVLVVSHATMINQE